MSVGSKASRLPGFVRQLFDIESWTYSYLIGCNKTRKALLIDPVDTQVERDVKLIHELGLQLTYAINTHCHADHVTGTGILKTLTGCQSMISDASEVKADIHLKHNEKIKIGDLELEARATPGHTNGCMSFISHDLECAFTGDTILIRACGRTDFQDGDPSLLYDSVQQQLFSLPKYYNLYPAHDYKGCTMSTIGEEMIHNPRLSKSKEEFIDIMKHLNLARPKKMDEAIPWNVMCGPRQLGERQDVP